MNELNYDTYRVRVNSETVKRFESMKNNRRIMPPHVSRLVKSLEEGKNFDSPIVINKTNLGKTNVIDGQHRIEALKRYLQAHTDKEIEIQIVAYHNVSQKKEREIFTRWNSGKAQSSNDFIRVHQDDIPILQWMLKSFPTPVRLYPITKNAPTGIHFPGFIKMYLSWKFSKFPRFEVYTKSSIALVKDCQLLEMEDYNNMAEFVMWFEKTFGKIEHSNPHCKKALMHCLMTFYLDNHGRYDDRQLYAMFQKKVYNRTHIIQFAAMSNRLTGIPALYNLIKSELHLLRMQNFKFREIA